VAQSAPTAFFSYSREDSDFALKLAGDLKEAGASVWLDQLDIHPGDRWDRTVEDALTNCPRMLVILSPVSVSSTNVMDEVSFALEEKKTVIPVMYRDCTVPFRLRRVQHVDFRQDYARGLQELLKILAPEQTAGQTSSVNSDVARQSQSPVSDAAERKHAGERARLEDERRKAAEQTRLEEERKQSAERARVEEEQRRAAEQARLEDERRKSAEQVERTKREREKPEHATQSDLRVKVGILIAVLAVALAITGYYIITAPHRKIEAARSHFINGKALYDQRKLDDAVIEYRQAIMLNPSFPEAHSALCLLLTLQDHLDGAVAECREAVRLRPEYAEAHYNLGMVLLKKQDEEGAKAELREVVTPETPQGFYFLSRKEPKPIRGNSSSDIRVYLSIAHERVPEEKFRFYLNGGEAMTLEALGPRLEAIFKLRAERVLWIGINASEPEPFSSTMQVVKIVREAGVDKIILYSAVPPPPPPT
jgi:tetratricopeptide (TPR) repeat protein